MKQAPFVCLGVKPGQVADGMATRLSGYGLDGHGDGDCDDGWSG